MKLIKTVEENKDMVFFMENGDVRVVENAKEVYAGYDGNGVKTFEVLDCGGKKYTIHADGIKRMGFKER